MCAVFGNEKDYQSRDGMLLEGHKCLLSQTLCQHRHLHLQLPQCSTLSMVSKWAEASFAPLLPFVSPRCSAQPQGCCPGGSGGAVLCGDWEVIQLQGGSPVAVDHPACAEWPRGTAALCCGLETSARARLGLPSELAVAQKNGWLL